MSREYLEYGFTRRNAWLAMPVCLTGIRGPATLAAPRHYRSTQYSILREAARNGPRLEIPCV